MNSIIATENMQCNQERVNGLLELKNCSKWVQNSICFHSVNRENYGTIYAIHFLLLRCIVIASKERTSQYMVFYIMQSELFKFMKNVRKSCQSCTRIINSSERWDSELQIAGFASFSLPQSLPLLLPYSLAVLIYCLFFFSSFYFLTLRGTLFQDNIKVWERTIAQRTHLGEQKMLSPFVMHSVKCYNKQESFILFHFCWANSENYLMFVDSSTCLEYLCCVALVHMLAASCLLCQLHSWCAQMKMGNIQHELQCSV